VADLGQEILLARIQEYVEVQVVGFVVGGRVAGGHVHSARLPGGGPELAPVVDPHPALVGKVDGEVEKEQVDLQAEVGAGAGGSGVEGGGGDLRRNDGGARREERARHGDE
jgi:hypothetical protein